jgi:hypothetical protein
MTHHLPRFKPNTRARLMLANDVNTRTVQNILGLRDIPTARWIYGPRLPSMRRKTGAILNQAKPTASPGEVGDAS